MRMGNPKIFSKLDLHTAYLQLPLDDASKEYTTINTTEGLYVYNYLPFGVASSPAIFQSVMCKILSGIDHRIIYQDDILIMTEDEQKHDQVLDIVLNRLMMHGLKLNVLKCAFYVKSINYLGHVFDENGVHTDYNKIRVILDAPAPSNVSQVQSFIGLCNFYKSFIPNFSETFAPLYKLLKKNTKFHWDTSHDKCFSVIKELSVHIKF